LISAGWLGRTPVKNVPLRLPRSVIQQLFFRLVSPAYRHDIYGSGNMV
jgi:hypothetical protein